VQKTDGPPEEDPSVFIKAVFQTDFAYPALNQRKSGVDQPHHLQKIQQFQGLAAIA